MKNKIWFTLVELIVVITILSILWTIAFISLWSYSINARDSTRFTDINNLETVFENFMIKRWIYPIPTNPINIVYSWWIVFRQWTYWEATHRQINELSKKPVDPLYEREYTYSISSTKRSYNLSWIQEWDSISYNFPIKKVNAETATREILARVWWNYNKQIVHTSTWWKVYVFMVPSLILSDAWDKQILNLSNKFVYDNEPNIPLSYSWTQITQVWSFEFTPRLVYSGTTLPKTPASLKVLVEWVQNAILWTVLYWKPEYKEIIELDIDDSNDLFYYGREYINKDLWWRFVLNYPVMCKEIIWTDDNKWSWMYTISPNWTDKISVYCDMDIDGWWWTRIRKWERGVWYTDIKTINKTRWITWSEIIEKYTRQWASNIWKQYWIYYKTFKVKQNDQNWSCWEHTTISDLVSQIVWWTRWDCSRSRCNVWVDPGCNEQEYIDIQVDDLWEDIWLTDDKVLSGFDDDPCITNGHKDVSLRDSARNVSWSSMWTINHRTNSTTSLTQLWWGNSTSWRCDWTNSDADWWYVINEVYVR